MNLRSMVSMGSASVMLAFALPGLAQDAEPREFVSRTFGGTQVINAQSIEVVPRKRSYGFMIQHRFGAWGFNKDMGRQFLGLDLPANIRFAFQYSPVDDMHLELGRSKNGKVYDLGAKVRLFKQTVEDEMPVSVTAWFNVALMSDDFPGVDDHDFFADGVTPFAYSFKHRLAYNSQIMIARRFSDHVSVQLAPVFVYRNLVPMDRSNLTLTLPITTRWKVTTKGSILFEAAPFIVGRDPDETLIAIATGYEIATAGHVFQIVLASGQEIVEQRLYTMPVTRYDEGYFHLGFNIARTLFVKPKQPKP